MVFFVTSLGSAPHDDVLKVHPKRTAAGELKRPREMGRLALDMASHGHIHPA
jgi:hypothetical protein